MAYAAVISLKQTIHRLLNSPRISIASPSRETLELSYKQLSSLQEALRRSDDSSWSSKRLNALDGQIREALHQFEDLLELQVSNQFVSTFPLELDLNEVSISQEISSFPNAVKNMEKDYIQELNHDDDDDGGDDSEFPSRTIDPGVKIVGLSDAFALVKEHVLRIIRPDDFGVFAFFGSAGNGRSLVAKSIYDDIYIRRERSFDCGAWVRVGSTYTLKQILSTITAQINDGDHQLLDSEGEDKLSECIYSSLEGRRYVVVLDDVRDVDILSRLRRSLPEQNNGSLVFLTTSLMEVAQFEESFELIEIPVVCDKLLSLSYLRLFMFGDLRPVAPQYEEALQKIAENCRGFRIVLAKVIFALLRSEKTLSFWLAAHEHDPIFTVDDEIFESSLIKENLREEDGIWANDLFDCSITVNKIKEHLYPDRLFPKMGIITLYGMAGVGKTTLIKKVVEDPSVLNRFDCFAWVNVGRNYQSQDILIDILAQIYLDIDKRRMKEDAKLAKDLCVQLSNKKCLVVLDDLWSQEPVHYLKEFLPNIKGELVVTTRLLRVGLFGPCDRVYKVRLLNKEESWDLLREKVFAEKPCPSQLGKPGMKIAKNCEGLPLLILAVAEHLSKSEKTLEYWNKVAERKFPVVMSAQNKIAKSLLPSYDSLPQHLKACFLFMGMFPQRHKIKTSKLMKLWFADGFLEPNPSQTVEDFALKCLKELVDRTMVMDRQKASDLKTYKTCSLHSVYWHLSCNEAIKNKFFHALDTYVDNSRENMKSRRRLCIRNSILQGIKDIHTLMDSSYTLRVLLWTGVPHKYPVPMYFGSRLMKVLDTLAIRLYEFPIEVVKLIHLRYLALTCDGELPASISKLWNLELLIARQHLSIKHSRNSSYLPKEIWDMNELKSLQVSGNNLPHPESGALLSNLSSLLGLSSQSCTRRVLKRIPNLKKLGIQIELSPDDKSDPFHGLNRVNRLRKLESLKCIVVNPDLGSEVVYPPAPLSMFPSCLKKLSLSGLGYPWEHMSIIGKLPNLEVLKLRCYAFQGSSWEIDYEHFSGLKFLLIEDTDIVRWNFKSPSISKLQCLSIKHCYELEQLPICLPGLVQSLVVVDSHPLALKWAKEMKDDNWERKIKVLELDIQSSWNDDDKKVSNSF